MSLAITDLSVRFGGLQALDNVDLQVAAGSMAGLIGPNGAGKTTLFNAVSGFVRPAAGRIAVNDADITGLPASERAALGIVRTFQHVGLVREVSVLANAMMAQHRRMDTGVIAGILGRAQAEERDMAARAAAALRRLGIESFASRRVRDLPHGVHKLVEVACAVVREPRVLLLDEPSAGLDPSETADLADRLSDLQAELGCTTLVIDHDMRLVRRLARHITVLSFGRVIAAGTWDEIRTNDAVVAAYLGEQEAGRARAR